MKNSYSDLKSDWLGWKDESGIALIMVILVSVLMLGLGLSLGVNSMLEVEVASNHERELLAFYAAQTGMERAIDTFRSSYNTTNLPVDGATLYTNYPVSYSGSTVTSAYSVSVARRDAPGSSPILPYPIHYMITSVGSLTPGNAMARVSSATLTQSVSVSPRTLANYALFYDSFSNTLAFSNFFKLTGRLAVNDDVTVSINTKVNGDFYAAGSISGGPPVVSGNITQNGGTIPFPTTVSPFATGVTVPYSFVGPTRIIFLSNGNVTFWNAGIAGGTKTVALPSNGLISVTGDAIVEGTIAGRATVTATDDILLNGNIRYADQTTGSWDTLALVAAGDVVIPKFQYTATSAMTSFEPTYASGGVTITGLTGGTFGSTAIPPSGQDFFVDASLVSLNGSSNGIVDPAGRPAQKFNLYGNTIGKKAVQTIAVSGGVHTNGLSLQINENKKLDLIPPPGFPRDTGILPTFFTFRELRTKLQ